MTAPGFLRAVGLIALLSSSVTSALAQDAIPNLNGYVTLANDYRDHGLSQLASGTSLQLGIDYEHDTGFFVGGLAANVDYAAEARFRKPREYLVNYYLGYTRRKQDWSFDVSVARYLYPGISFSYDYTQLTFGVSYKSRFLYRASYVDELLGLPYRGWYQELGIRHPLRWGLELGAEFGALSADEIGNGGYTYWNVGVSKVIRSVGLDLRFHEAGADYPSLLGDPDGSRWVFSVTYGLASKD